MPYNSVDIYHIGTRDNISLEEKETEIGIKKLKTYECGSLNALIEMASKLKYCEEGYVVKDKNYHRIKVKSPAYVAAQHLIEGMNDKRMLELLKMNEADEFLTYFPEYKEYVDALLARVENITGYINEIIMSEIDRTTYGTRKEFAEAVSKTKYPAFFFQYYDEKVENPAEWLWSMSGEKILEQINKL